MTISPGDVTLLLGKLKRGDQAALAELNPIVYKELRRLAAYYLRNERIGHTLQPTAPVHEVDLAVDEALTRLSRFDPQQCRVVELRYFGALAVEEIAEVLGVSPRTVDRDWTMAKASLRAELKGVQMP